MTGRAVAGIQARLSSQRLPGKVLMDIGGKPLIQRVVERVAAAELVDEVVVLTSDDPSDDALVEALDGLGIPHRRGPLEDVLSRFVTLMNELDPDYVVRVCGDCPLLEPAHVDRQLEALRSSQADFVHLRGNETSAYEGTLGGPSAFSARALRRAVHSLDPRDAEHVGSFYFRVHLDDFRRAEITVDELYRRPDLRLTVDEQPDLDLVRAVYAGIGDAGTFSTAQAIRWLDEHPEVAGLNREVAESRDNRALRDLTRKVLDPDRRRSA